VSQSTPWLETLNLLRPHLVGRRDENGHVGSLRWLENQMGARGASSGAVRNIVYREIGTSPDKALLRGVLETLCQSVGLELPHSLELEPLEHDLYPQVRQLLGREKRMVYRRFLSGVRAGGQPKMLILGRHGAGKTMLMDHLCTALTSSSASLQGDPVRLHIGGELAPELERLFGQLKLARSSLHAPLSRLQESAPFAVSGSLQAEVGRALITALETVPESVSGRVLLLRAGQRGTLAGSVLRLPDGSSATPSLWAWHHLLEPLQNSGWAILALLNTLEGLPPNLGVYGEATLLPPPTLEEARRFVRLKLPYLPPPEVERIVGQAGRDYEALGLLTLLSGVEAEDGGRLPALRDERLRDFLEALSVACPPAWNDVDSGLLSSLLERRSLEDLPALERAFLESSGRGLGGRGPDGRERGGRGRVRPTSRPLLEKLLERYPHDRAERRRVLHQKAALLSEADGEIERALEHALEAGDGPGVVRLCLDSVSQNGVVVVPFGSLENAWRRLKSGGLLPLEDGERLTLAVVEHYTTLGRYQHPSLDEALEVLRASPNPASRLLTQVRAVERAVEVARFEDARAALQPLPDPMNLALSEALEHLELGAATRGELALAHVALLRWEGQAALALRYVEVAAQCASSVGASSVNLEPLEQKTRFWRGLIRKDLGQWEGALLDLGSVSGSSMGLLSARAQYQLGDMWMRLGQQGWARDALEQALEGLRSSEAPLGEVSRARTGLGTALRRLGRLEEASRTFTAAAVSAPDDYTRARAQSEAVLLHAARGQFSLALDLGHWAWRSFRDASSVRPAEADYRRQRVAYRVALVYLARGLGRPYLPPLLGAREENPDLMHARALLEHTLKEVRDLEAERSRSLRMDCYLALGLATPDPQQALLLQQTALEEASHPYHVFQAHTYLAEAQFRAGNTSGALSEVNRAHVYARRAARLGGTDRLFEPSFNAWLALLEALSLLGEDRDSALEVLQTALEDFELKPFCGGLLSAAVAGGFSLEELRLEASPLLRPEDSARAAFER